MTNYYGTFKPWSYKGTANYGGVGNYMSSPNTQNDNFKMIDYSIKRNSQVAFLENRYIPQTYGVSKNHGIDQIYSLNNYINGHPKNIKLVPYPQNTFKLDPAVHYDEGKNTTLLRAVENRYINVSGVYKTKNEIENRPKIDSTLAGRHRVAPSVF